MEIPTTSTSVFDSLPKMQIGERQRIQQAFKSDEDSKKVGLFLHDYIDENDDPFILPVIKKCMKTVAGRDLSNVRDLFSFCDMDEYSRLCCELLFGENSRIIKEKRCLVVNTVSNIGAISIGAEFLRKQNYTSFVVEKPDTQEYSHTFKTAGFSKQYYFRLPEVSAREGRYKNMIADLEKAPFRSVVIFRMCNLDSTGLDPSFGEWEMISKVIKEREMFPFIDAIFQGFISGDPDADAWPLRYFADRGLEMFVSQSFSLNMGLFLERPSNLILVQRTPFVSDNLRTYFKMIARYSICNPPAFGALIVRNILGDPKLKNLFHENLADLVHKNQRMRESILAALKGSKSVGEDQKGLYLDLELSTRQVNNLSSEYHIYLPGNGRIYLTRLHNHNLDYVCKCLQAVIFGKDELRSDIKNMSSKTSLEVKEYRNTSLGTKKKKKKKKARAVSFSVDRE